MARQDVVKVRCDRCKREELQVAGPKKELPDFECQYKGNQLSYPDLCERCVETIAGFLKRIKEWERELCLKFGPVIDPNKAAPITAAPDYTPPKPHSAAALKR